MRRKTSTQCTLQHPAEPRQHRLPEDPENNAALPQSLPSAPQVRREEGKQLPRAPAVKRMTESCYHGIWGVQFFPNKRWVLEQPQRGCSRGGLCVPLAGSPCCLWTTDYWLFFQVKSEEKNTDKRFCPCICRSECFPHCRLFDKHLFPGVTEMASYTPPLPIYNKHQDRCQNYLAGPCFEPRKAGNHCKKMSSSQSVLPHSSSIVQRCFTVFCMYFSLRFVICFIFCIRQGKKKKNN